MTSPIPLRERLAAAEAKAINEASVGGFHPDPSVVERAANATADRMLPVFRDWLRDRAQQRRAEINEFPTDSYDPVKFPVEAASALRAEADAIDKELNQ